MNIRINFNDAELAKLADASKEAGVEKKFDSWLRKHLNLDISKDVRKAEEPCKKKSASLNTAAQLESKKRLNDLRMLGVIGYAKKYDGGLPNDETRLFAIEHGFAVEYAKYVDGGPHSDTRAAVYRRYGKVELINWLKNIEKPSEEAKEAAIEVGLGYEYALYTAKEPCDATRKNAVEEGKSLSYAIKVDKGPHNLTRKGIIDYDDEILKYARIVDRGPHNVTRNAAVNNGKALEYAKTIDKGPHPATRRGCSSNTFSQSCMTAFYYARDIDKKPHPLTRARAMQDSESAYKYARFVDQKPSKKSREIAMRGKYWKLYVIKVDNCHPNPVTRRRAVIAGSYDALWYALKVDRKAHPLTRKAAFKKYALRYCFEVEQTPNVRSFLMLPNNLDRLAYINKFGSPLQW